LSAHRKVGSQFREDEGIQLFFKNCRDGIFVEVGANDGVCGSNTFELEQGGWNGVLIEPSERLAKECELSRPKSIVVRKAIVGDSQVDSVEFFEYSTSGSGARYDGLSRVGQPSAYDDAARAAGVQIQKSFVQAATLDSVLRDCGIGTVDFLSIDVEGMELDVLRGFSLDRFQPRLIIVEDNSFGADRSVAEHLRKHGYAPIYRTFVNLWFVPIDLVRVAVDVICIRHTLSSYLSFKLVAAESGLSMNPRFYSEIKQMIGSERGRFSGLKYFVIRSCPLWLLLFCRHVIRVASRSLVR
jgi:FkbM family methyltransferase